MLEFNRKKDSSNLSDHFGLNNDDFESIADRWVECQREINASLHKAIDLVEDGVTYDASMSMEVFFKHFNTQELQDIALIQFLMQDLQGRAENKARQLSESAFKEMLEGEREDDGDDDEIDFEELL